MLTNKIKGIMNAPIVVENAKPAAVPQPVSIVVRLRSNFSTSRFTTGLMFAQTSPKTRSRPTNPIPTRYTHTSNETMMLSDINALLNLLTHLVNVELVRFIKQRKEKL